MKDNMIEALQRELGGAAMEKARLTVLAMRLRAALISGDGREALIAESEFLASPEQAVVPDWISYDERTGVVTIHGIKYAADLFRDFASTLPLGKPFTIVSRDDGTLTVTSFDLASPEQAAPVVATCRDDGRCQYAIDHGAEGMAACPAGKCCMAPTPSAETIDSGDPHALVSGWRDAAQVGPGDRIAEAWRKLIAHIDARMAAAREQALEELASHFNATHRELWTPDIAEEIRALKSQPATHPAQEAKAQPEIQPAAGLTDAGATSLSDKQIDDLFNAQYEEYGQLCDAEDMRMFARAVEKTILAQQPAQAVAGYALLQAAPVGQREAILGAVKFVEQNVKPRRCDDPAVSCCVRCNSVYLASVMGKLLAAPLATHEGKAGDELDKLYSGIINLPCKIDPHFNASQARMYKIGHRDARHAAAELVAAMQAQQAGKAGA